MRKRPCSPLVSFLVLCVAATPAAGGQRVAQSAPGGPVRPCTEGPARLARLERVLPVQRDALRKMEEQLNAARAGNLQALKDRESADIVRQKIDSWVDDQKGMLADAAASRITGVPAETIGEYKEKFEKWKSSLEKLQRSATAGYSYGAAIRENAAALKDYMKVLEFLDESGIGEGVARTLAKATFGPAGDKAIDGFNLARDWVLAELQQNISDQQVAQLRDTYYRMHEAVMGTEGKIDDLRALLAGCPGAQQPEVQQSPKPIPPQAPSPPAARPSPSEPAQPQPTKKGGMSKGTRIAVVTGMLGAGGVAAAVLGSQAGKSGGSGGSTGSNPGGGSGSGGGSIRLVSFTTFVCRRDTRSCSGTVTLDIPVVMNSGNVIVVSTSGFAGERPVSRTAPAGTQTFTLTRSFSDILEGCLQTQRELGIWNGTNINVTPQTASLTGLNIPVSCQ